MNTNSEEMIYLIGNPTEGFDYSHGPYEKDFGGSIEDNDHPINLQAEYPAGELTNLEAPDPHYAPYDEENDE